MQLLEHRGETKTFRELREMVAAMDVNSDHKLSFLVSLQTYIATDLQSINIQSVRFIFPFTLLGMELRSLPQRLCPPR